MRGIPGQKSLAPAPTHHTACGAAPPGYVASDHVPCLVDHHDFEAMGAISTVAASVLAIPVGLMFDGTPLSLLVASTLYATAATVLSSVVGRRTLRATETPGSDATV